MNPQTLTRTALAAALSLTTLLAACGGGGGGGAPTNTASTSSAAPKPTSSTPSPSASTPQAATFPTTDVLMQQAYAYIQTLKNDMGLHYIPGAPQAPNPVLNQAAQNHLNYMLTNKAFTASENMSLPAATGSTPTQQADSLGYAYTASSEFAPLPPGVTGSQWVDAILSTGTGAWLLFAHLDDGFAFSPWPNSSTPTALAGLIMTGEYPEALAKATTNGQELFVYPYNGQTNVPPTNLVPDYPGATLNLFAGDAAGSHGTPITFIVGVYQFVQINSATLKDAKGNVIPVTTYGLVTNPATGVVNGTNVASGWGTGAGVVMPSAPLQPNTTYTLTYNVTYGLAVYPNQQSVPASQTNQQSTGTLTFTTGSQQPFNPNKLF
jgi:hypothetical protein